jgi:phosphate transport system permease protein
MINTNEKSGRRFRRKLADFLAVAVSSVATAVAVAAFLIILGYLALKGFRSIHWSTFLESATPMGTPGGGLRNAIMGSFVLVLMASCIGVPVGILGGIYQARSKNHFANAVRFLTDVLNSIPSIVIGVFVYTVWVIPVAQRHPGQGFSALAGAFAMSIIMIPTIMRTTEGILRMVPVSMSEASYALGSSQLRTMFRIVLPAARSGIITGVMLAIARVAGETAPLLFTAFGNVAFSMRPDKPIDALPLSIFQNATSPYPYLHDRAMAASLLLVGLVCILSIITRASMKSRVFEGH